ncbi:carbohydrate binding family 9 domain-containing protein [Candidatus Poribacteria bacterium]|nr:carbohydrate binding family 9 domain-containing protein [Candidatus Poribacteria bacterium]
MSFTVTSILISIIQNLFSVLAARQRLNRLFVICSSAYFFILTPNLSWAHNEGFGQHVIEAYRLEDVPPPKIDGRLDDPVWHHPKSIHGFIQLEPERAKPATDDTTVYIAYDRHNLYIAFQCDDAEPDKIVNRLARREQVFDSDLISFFIDPLHDHRTGYKFATTPAGVQNDDYRYEDTKRDRNWKGIWWVESHIHESGWSAEFKIPFANFRFAEKREQVWGFDVERVNRRKSEVTVWKQMTQAGPVTRMSDLGHLVGLRDIESGKQFEISPYLLSGVSDTERQSAAEQVGVGLDVQYSLKGALKTNLTLNPDFAQVEADQLEINLTRFPTRFPEQRPFFVEGNSFFETPLDLFFSRRIGSRGDILWGGKMTGKVGDYSIALLGSQTGSFSALELGQESELKESALYSAIRLKKDILKRSNIGVLFTNKEQEDSHSRIGGVDMNLALGKTYHMSAQYAQSFQPSEDTQNHAYVVEFSQRNYLWNTSVGLERVAPLFEINQTGFLRKEQYRGWQRANMRTTYEPQFGRFRGFFRASGDVSQSLYTNAYFTNWQQRNPELRLSPKFDEDLIAWNASIDAGVEFVESVWDDIGAFYSRSREIELTDVFIANGFGFFIDTNSSLAVSGGLQVDIGDFFNFDKQSIGKQRQLSLSSTIRPRSNFTLEFDSSYAQSLDEQRVIDGRFLVSSLRMTYLFTRDSFLRVFAQTGRERTTFDELQTERNYLVSFLFGWEYSPKSHFFVAYNEDWDTSEGKLRLGNRVVAIKISYLANL